MKTTKLRRYLSERGIKQRFVALNAKIPDDVISQLATGIKEPTDRQKKIIAKVLKVKKNEIF